MNTHAPANDRRSVLQDALRALDEMQARVESAERRQTEPVAIVGMSCRFPGGAASPDDYWNLILNGVDAVTPLPEDRDNLVGGIDGAFDRSLLQAGFLSEIDTFDPQLFGISPREAMSMDPQQRLVLEASWEALERAGIAPDSLTGSTTGVFVGITTNDYGQLQNRNGASLDVYAATGSALNAVPGRVAYTLGLNGPAIAIDTACSSSLVAVHLAIQSLRSGESNLALAGGVNITLLPEAFACFTNWGMLAANARCKAFDASADGFVRGEGCGIVALKRLEDARRDGDPILAIIRGSAVNQDGRSSGLTVPSGPAQRAVIQAAMRNAGVSSAEVQYIEAHGTGTTLGDPIEVEALGNALRQRPSDGPPLYIGSVKANIGHLESSAGIAGLIKVVLMLQHGQIPPQIHFNEKNPGIPWPAFPVEIPTTVTDWPDGPRIAGVSGFGLSGTNAHVVLEAAPVNEQSGPTNERPQHVLALSARTENALRDLAKRYTRHFVTAPDLKLADVAATANRGRAHLAHRLAVVGTDIENVSNFLSAYADGKPLPGTVSGVVPVGSQARPVFLFTGQGAQYAGMGRTLYATEPIFRAALDRCAAILDPLIDQSLLDILLADPDTPEAAKLDQTTWTQPAMVALELALATLWQAWGIRPVAVAGHSLGEYAAAIVAGVLSLEDGLRLVAARGKLMGHLPAGGAMAAIFAPLASVEAVLAGHAGVIGIAAVNGPAHTVVSGDAEVVRAVADTFTAAGTRVHELTVSHAFHSALMEPIIDEFARELATVTFHQPQIRLYSNLTGTLSDDEIVSPDYWCRHLLEPVRFDSIIASLVSDGYDLFFEIGPHPVLLGMAREMQADGCTWLPSLRRNRDEWQTILMSLAQAYVSGVIVDWASVTGPYARERVDLPTYPFQRQHYWTTPSAVTAPVQQRHLLGKYVSLGADDRVHLWEGTIDTERFPYLADHRVQDAAVLPATAYVEMVLQAITELFGAQPVVVNDVTYEQPIIFRDSEAYTVQVVLRTDEDVSFEIHSRPATERGRGGWTRNVRGTVRYGTHISGTPMVDLSEVRERCANQVAGPDFYRDMAERGNQWGPAFQGTVNVWRGSGEALSVVQVPDSLVATIDDYRFHPAVSDACGHVLTAAFDPGEHPGAFVGGSLDEARLYRQPRGTRLWSYARLRQHDDERSNVLVGDVQVFDDDGELISETIGARLWYLDIDASRGANRNWIHLLDWQPQALPTSERKCEAGLPWIILADDTGVGDIIARELQERGQDVVIARRGTEFVRQPDGSYRLRPDVLDDFGSFLAATCDLNVAQGVIHLWSLNAPVPDGVEDAGLTSMLHLVQAIAARPWRHHPRMWFITRGAQPAGVGAVHPNQAPIWGMGRSLALEHAELWGGLIDIDPGDSPADAGKRITQELLHMGEDQVALRGSERYVARLTCADPLSTTASLELRPDASYLITGGLGGLALRLADRLVSRGAGHLILMGRTSLPPRSEWGGLDASSQAAARALAITSLEERGATVYLVTADVADEQAVRSAIDEATAAGAPPIAGVFHTAGTLSHSTLATLTLDAMQAELRAKIGGGWVLHRVCSDASLDYFTLFSSASALLSSPQLGAYAAANAYLDALAHYRRANGLPGLSINWGLWGEIGMAAQFAEDDVATLALRGMGMIPPETGMDILELLLQSDLTQAAVLPVNWSRWRERYPAFTQAPLLARIMEQYGDTESLAAPLLTRAALEAVGADERLQLLETYVSAHVARVLGMPVTDLDPTEPLTTMGMDSLMAIEIKNQIERDLDVVVPVVQLLQGPTVNGLATFVLDAAASTSDPLVATPALENGANADLEDLLSHLDDLTDDEIDSLLANLSAEENLTHD